MEISALQKARYEYAPKLPGMLRHGIADICVKEGEETQSVADQEKIKALFPNTYGKKEITFQKGANTSVAKKQVVGVILSGGQAPGGHNVICGLYDALKATNPENVLYGFKNGPSGLIEDDYLVFDDEYINAYRNTGGFDIIGSGRTKLETQEQFAIAAEVCKKHGITAIVIIGGDDSNTNAAVLAEYFAANNTGVQVIGCPKTIDGDLKNEDIECSFGFDTAAKTYSEVIGNIERDANSAKKYWHFIKVMGQGNSDVRRTVSRIRNLSCPADKAWLQGGYMRTDRYLSECERRCHAAVWIFNPRCAFGVQASDRCQWDRTERRPWNPGPAYTG